MRVLSSTEQRTFLTGRGIKRADIDIAFRLKDMIEALDGAIFPKNPTRVRIHPASKRDWYAMYTLPRSIGGDYYTIFAKNLRENLKERAGERVMVLRKSGSVASFTNSCHSHSLIPAIACIACHEVRHRMQFRGKVRCFAQQLRQDESTELLKESTRYVHILCDILKKEGKRASSQRQNRIKNMTSRCEVDSMIIETMILNGMRPGDGLDKIIPILLLGTN